MIGHKLESFVKYQSRIGYMLLTVIVHRLNHLVSYQFMIEHRLESKGKSLVYDWSQARVIC